MPAFVDDDTPWVASRDDLSAPATYRQLLNRIGVPSTASAETIRAEVADWLRRNDAPPSLLKSLNNRGMLPLSTA